MFVLVVVVCIMIILFPAISSGRTNDWTVITSSDDTLRMCTVRLSANGRMMIYSANMLYDLPIESLKTVIVPGEPQFWRGAGIGALAGGVLGGAIAGATMEEHRGGYIDLSGIAVFGGGILGAAAGFAVGGVIGAASGADDVYEFSGQPNESKIRCIRKLIRDN
jgi:hypothetical protein